MKKNYCQLIPAWLEFLIRIAYGKNLVVKKKKKASANKRPVQVSAAELVSALREIGVRQGDILMLHSSMPGLQQIAWSGPKFIDFILDYLGEEGTLLMPTHPILTVRDGMHYYDVDNSPSSVGLLTELFRRRKGVIRSLYPYSSVAGIGKHAAEMIDDHINSFAPHDEHSPYYKLYKMDGKVLGVGVNIDRMTVLHVAEDSLRDIYPIEDFYVTDDVIVRNKEKEYKITAHIRSPWLWWYLAMYKWTAHVLKKKLVKSPASKNIPFSLVSAKSMAELMREDVERGRTIYPYAFLNKYFRLGEPHYKTQEN